VVPTSTQAAAAPYRPEIVVAGHRTLALCDALISVDPSDRFGDQVDYLSFAALREIDESLALLLDLDLAWRTTRITVAPKSPSSFSAPSDR
jgi:hypothetical protein